MAISADEAMSQIFDWVNNGDPISDDSGNDDNDLDDLYGEDNVVRVPDCHSDKEDSNRQSDNSDEDASPQHVPVRKSHPKQTLTSNIPVNSINSCLNPSNFNETI